MNQQKEILDLINENRKLIWSICLAYFSEPLDREDLYQEIIYKVLKSYSGFKNQSKFSTWLYRVGINTAITYKKRNTKQNHFVDESYTKSYELEDNLDVEIKTLYNAIEKLNKVEKGIILLYLEEKPYEEIAAITGFSKKNVSVKIVRIKRKLEQIYTSLI